MTCHCQTAQVVDRAGAAPELPLRFAVTERFELSVRASRTHAFQACLFGHLSTPPNTGPKVGAFTFHCSVTKSQPHRALFRKSLPRWIQQSPRPVEVRGLVSLVLLVLTTARGTPTRYCASRSAWMTVVNSCDHCTTLLSPVVQLGQKSWEGRTNPTLPMCQRWDLNPHSPEGTSTSS